MHCYTLYLALPYPTVHWTQLATGHRGAMQVRGDSTSSVHTALAVLYVWGATYPLPLGYACRVCLTKLRQIMDIHSTWGGLSWLVCSCGPWTVPVRVPEQFQSCSSGILSFSVSLSLHLSFCLSIITMVARDNLYPVLKIYNTLKRKSQISGLW
jgi:hypothetical protein